MSRPTTGRPSPSRAKRSKPSRNDSSEAIDAVESNRARHRHLSAKMPPFGTPIPPRLHRTAMRVYRSLDAAAVDLKDAQRYLDRSCPGIAFSLARCAGWWLRRAERLMWDRWW